MEESNILDYILIILMFPIIIHILTQIYNKKESTNTNNQSIPVTTQKNIIVMNKTHSNTNNPTYHKNKKKNYGRMYNLENINTSTVNGKYPTSDVDNKTEQYIKKAVMRGSFDHDSSPEQNYSNKKILKYQNEFFGFNDKINFNSSNELDPVDKMNEMQISCKNELSNIRNQRISDIYASLTQ